MSEVELEERDGIAVLTINRPEARNAIRLRTIAELDQVLTVVEKGEARVLIVRGAGTRSFISGGDLKEFAAIRKASEAASMASNMRSVLDRLATLPVPVIAALNGHALGGGAEVAIAADIRIAADDAKIGFTQVSLGIIPAWGGIERLTNLVGRGHALSLICGASVLSASEAVDIGLVDVAVPRPLFEEEWQRRARVFAELPAGRSRVIAEIVKSTRQHTHVHLAQKSIAAFAQTWTSEEHWNALETRR